MAIATMEGEVPLFTTLEEVLGECIPAGVYTCRRSFYHKGGYEAFEVMDVPNRTRILIHKGNTIKDTEGCILVGMTWAPPFGIAESTVAFSTLMHRLKNFSEFQLIIRPPVSET